MVSNWKEYAIETCWQIINEPQGSLWNYGTTPTSWQKSEWKGRKEAAQEILDAILITPPKPSTGADNE